jgi:uncharacterized protein YutE (UPF0331/DUF86 family)
MKKAALIVLPTLILLAPAALLMGCSSQGIQQAEDARSSYISARAVLVGVQEFPGRIEEIIKSQNPPELAARAQELSASTRNLLTSAASAFATVKQNAERLKSFKDGRIVDYGNKLLELEGLNEQVLNSYSELIGLSNSLASSMPYNQDPNQLMPSLIYLDSAVTRIEQLMDQIRQQEAEAEQSYLALMKEG